MFLPTDKVRAALQNGHSANQLEVLVDTSAVVLGGEVKWRLVRKLRKPGARFGLEVWLEGPGDDVGSFRVAEVRDVRLAV